MATPYDDHRSYSQMSSLQSSLSSQTNLAGTYDQHGSSGTKRKLSTKRPKLPKIKSAGALASARANNDGLGARGNSVSATPTSPTFVPDYLLKSSGSFLPTAHTERAVQPSRKKSSNAKIKPLLSKKTSSRKQMNAGIDLSRSAADNEGLAGVFSAAGSSDLNLNAFSSPALPMRRESISQHLGGYHNRTTSANSQISTSTSTSNRYVHPMRQTPHAYTPPMAGSYKTSFDSDSTPVTSDLDTSSSIAYAPLPKSAGTTTTTSTNPSIRTKLPHIRTTSNNSPRLASSSQTNLHNPETPSSLRNPPLLSDTPFPDMTSPLSANGTARSSMETASTGFRKNRSRSNTAGTAGTQQEPRTQAEIVQEARAAWREKEARKEREYLEKEALKAAKERRKEEKREDRERRTSEKTERKMASRNRSRATSKANSEKSSLSLATFNTRDGPFGATAEQEMQQVLPTPQPPHPHPSHPSLRPVDRDAMGAEMFGSDVQQLRGKTSQNLPRYPQKQRARAVTGGSAAASGGGGGGRGEKAEKVAGGWSLFWFRFKTMWLKMTRQMGGGGGT